MKHFIPDYVIRATAVAVDNAILDKLAAEGIITSETTIEIMGPRQRFATRKAKKAAHNGL